MCIKCTYMQAHIDLHTCICTYIQPCFLHLYMKFRTAGPGLELAAPQPEPWKRAARSRRPRPPRRTAARPAMAAATRARTGKAGEQGAATVLPVARHRVWDLMALWSYTGAKDLMDPYLGPKTRVYYRPYMDPYRGPGNGILKIRTALRAHPAGASHGRPW